MFLKLECTLLTFQCKVSPPTSAVTKWLCCLFTDEFNDVIWQRCAPAGWMLMKWFRNKDHVHIRDLSYSYSLAWWIVGVFDWEGFFGSSLARRQICVSHNESSLWDLLRLHKGVHNTSETWHDFKSDLWSPAGAQVHNRPIDLFAFCWVLPLFTAISVIITNPHSHQQVTDTLPASNTAPENCFVLSFKLQL